MSRLVRCLPLLLLSACARDGALPGPDDASSPPDGPRPIASACVGLAECDCWQTPGCQVIADGCWCPAPQCDPNGACLCGGGPFLGCAAIEANCPQVHCGLVGTASPDIAGCPKCDPLPDCATAKAKLASLCQFANPFLDGLRCDRNPGCVAGCFAKLRACADVGCTFCSTCDCAGQPTPFSACVAACLGG